MEYCKTKLELFILKANWLIIRIRFIHDKDRFFFKKKSALK